MREREVRLLAEEMMGAGASVESVARVEIGHSCESWVVRMGETSYLLKIAVRKDTLENIHSQQEIGAWVRAQGVPVPKIVAVSAPPNRVGRHAYLQEFLPGRDAEAAWPLMSAEQRAAFSRDWGRAVGLIHNIEGAGFGEGVLEHHLTSRSWREFAEDRLARLEASNRECGVLEEAQLVRLVGGIRKLMAELDLEGVKPRLTHRDLYFPNVLVHEGKFSALLDFEIARFYDPLFDFVKLGMWVLREHPEVEEPFKAGYREVQGWGEDFDKRILLCTGMEYLSCFSYFGCRYPDMEVIADIRGLLEVWLAKVEG